MPGEFHGQRSLGTYSLWGHKELDKTELLSHTNALFYSNVGSGKIGVQKLNQRAVFLVFRTENEC